MNVEVLGDDVQCDGWIEEVGSALGKAFTSDTAKQVGGAVLQTIGGNMTQTQKATFATVQTALGVQPIPFSNASPGAYPNIPQNPPKPDYTPYYIMGGVAIVAALVMFSTSKKI